MLIQEKLLPQTAKFMNDLIKKLSLLLIINKYKPQNEEKNTSRLS